MSKFSGKCDLYDHIYSIGNTKNKSELELFEDFKKSTKGVLYQSVKTPINKNNFDRLVEIEKEVLGDRYTLKMCLGKDEDGQYCYHGQTFKTIKSLSKRFDYYITKEIHFNTMIDLVKYYPYIIGMMSSSLNDDGTRDETIFITQRSYPDTKTDDFILYSKERDNDQYHETALSNEYIRIVKEYY